MGNDSRQRLSSWKEIAQYVHRDVRSVMRWEKERGLPVHRVPGGHKGRVWAFADELDDWLAQPSIGLDTPATVHVSTRRSLRRWHMALACGVVVAVAASVFALVPREPPADVTVEGNVLTAVTASGRALWTQEIAPGEEVMPATGAWRRVADLDGDGQAEIVVALAHRRAPEQLPVNTLYCFDRSGRLLWSHTPDDRLRFGTGEYSAPWVSWNLFVVRTARGPRVAWPVHHHTWWPSMLLLFDAAGARERLFVHPGWLTGVSVSDDGRRLFVTGSSNSREAYIMAVLDVDRLDAVAPEESGSPYECIDCGAVRPVRYYVFPRTEASRVSRFPDVRPGVQLVDGEHFQVNVSEGPPPIWPGTIYTFTLDGGRLLRAAHIDSYWEWHREQERTGAIGHTAEQCPERRALTVAHWSAPDGWTISGADSSER